MTWLQPAADAVPHYLSRAVLENDLSLGRQEVNAVIFATKLMVGMSFVLTFADSDEETSDDDDDSDDDIDDDNFDEEGDD